MLVTVVTVLGTALLTAIGAQVAPIVVLVAYSATLAVVVAVHVAQRIGEADITMLPLAAVGTLVAVIVRHLHKKGK